MPVPNPPASIAILQPGVGLKSQNALTEALPSARLFNAYAPLHSTGLLCLEKCSRSGLRLGLQAPLHRIAITDVKTSMSMSTGHCGQLCIAGQMMMACAERRVDGELVKVGEKAIINAGGSLELAYGSPILDPRTYLEDDIACLPQVADCCALILEEGLRIFVSSVQTPIDKSDVVRGLTAYASRNHSYFDEWKGTITAVASVPRSSKGKVDVERLLSLAAAAAPPLSLSSGSGPQMGFFVDSACVIPSVKKSDLARKAKTAGKLATKIMSKSSTASNTSSTSSKKPVRDSKRRATHSQIERRRREKINDRLVTLRTIVPVCVAEVEERKRVKVAEAEEARRIAAGEIAPSNGTAKGKRKRNRRKPVKAGQEGEKEDELGLHKLEVLTHAIEYIYELQDRINELETGAKSVFPSRKKLDLDEGEAAEEEEEEEVEEEAQQQQKRQQEVDDEEEEEDDEDGSEAHLEMAEWKGIRPHVKQRLSDETLGLVNFTTRRSTISSDRSSLARSPAVMSLSSESPMFSTATPMSSASSAYTNLTSPMMSLSSESPILRWGSNPSSALSGSSRDKEAGVVASSSSRSSNNGHTRYSSVIVNHHEWQLPGPALSLDASEKRVHNDDVGTSASPSLQHRQPSTFAQEAHLLLNFSTSPEVLRPLSAIRKTAKPTKSHRNNTITMAETESSTVGEHDPGSSHSSVASDTLLASPPLLALDASTHLSTTPADAMLED
ncbi:hypothetical protein CBS101457_002411 [Exobasidium rhododendri]|nr:hypothetical protein CBS101457_002411 [Exobasidium rhododendri]